MADKHLDILDDTEYTVDVYRDEDGYDIIEISKPAHVGGTNFYDVDILLKETIFGGVTEEKIRRITQDTIDRNKKAEILYGTYTGKRDTE